jgi:hypothetical protein
MSEYILRYYGFTYDHDYFEQSHEEIEFDNFNKLSDLRNAIVTAPQDFMPGYGNYVNYDYLRRYEHMFPHSHGGILVGSVECYERQNIPIDHLFKKT